MEMAVFSVSRSTFSTLRLLVCLVALLLVCLLAKRLALSLAQSVVAAHPLLASPRLTSPSLTLGLASKFWTVRSARPLLFLSFAQELSRILS